MTISKSRRIVLVAILVTLLVVSGIVTSLGKKDQTKATEQPNSTQQSEQPQVAAAETKTDTTVDDQSDDQTQVVVTETLVAEEVTTTVKTASTTPQSQTPAQTTPETPQEETPAPEEETPEEEPEEEVSVVFAPVGGASDSFIVESTDGTVYRWFPACPATWSDEALPEDKPLADMFMVLEDPEVAGGHVGSSVSFHIRAQDFAVVGDEFECGFFVMDEATGDVFSHTFMVVIVPADFDPEEV